MGLSRRQFTKEFKLAAVRRLEQGVSITEAARALEVNANVLHRWLGIPAKANADSEGNANGIPNRTRTVLGA
jgi:transposase-like protein